MCLNSATGPFIADMDIPVLKVVGAIKAISEELLNKAGLKLNTPYPVRISGHSELPTETEGILVLKGTDMFILTNDVNLDGTFYKALKGSGYKYSWGYDSSVIHINNINLDIDSLIAVINYRTPYRDSVVEIGETYTSNLCYYNDGSTVEEGLHSYKITESNVKTAGVLVECIIPKGATYYTGYFNGRSAYASNTLTYVKIKEE